MIGLLLAGLVRSRSSPTSAAVTASPWLPQAVRSRSWLAREAYGSDRNGLAVLDAVERSLNQQDPAMAYYPLPIKASQCFAGTPAQVNALTHAQFRAEAEYILGNSQAPESRQAIEHNLQWLDAAFEHGCAASLDMRPVLRKQLANYP